MKKICMVIAVIIALAPLQANAFDWMSAVKFWERASESQAAQAQTTKSLAEIETQMAAIDKSVQSTFLNIVKELSTRRETKNIKSQLNESNTNLTKVIESYANTMANNQTDLTKDIKKLSNKKKTALVNNISALSEYGQQYLLLATDGVRTASNTLRTAQKLSEFATTVSNVNRIAADLKTRATAVINMTNQIKTIAAAAGVSVK